MENWQIWVQNIKWTYLVFPQKHQSAGPEEGHVDHVPRCRTLATAVQILSEKPENCPETETLKVSQRHSWQGGTGMCRIVYEMRLNELYETVRYFFATPKERKKKKKLPCAFI